MILLTGGAGYIGSLVSRKLLDEGHEVAVVDNLSTGCLDAVDPRAEFYQLDLRNSELVTTFFREKKFDLVLHFAAAIDVAESIDDPIFYYYNNFVGTLNLLQAMQSIGCHKIIFSSTAAVYAESRTGFVDEDSVTIPTTPYGKSKLFSEDIIRDLGISCGLKSIILRYFNVAGASKDLSIGPRSKDPKSLFRRASLMAIRGDIFTLNGSDYQTQDGTPVRDYIHVEDLADIHVLAVKKILMGQCGLYNCGYGKGYSIKQVIDEINLQTKGDLRVTIGARRPGDLAVVVANTSRLTHDFQWYPKHDSLAELVHSSIAWEAKSLNQRRAEVEAK